MPPKLIPICAVVGPTASGKTDLAVAIAQKYNGEVISFDSMQIYRDAPIATAIPTSEEQKGIPHHLMGFLESHELFSVARYTELAHHVIRDVYHRGKLPVLVGGTGLYYSALLDHLQFSRENQNTHKIRTQLNERCEKEGMEALYIELQAIDPDAAAGIHINNRVRVLRALEIYYATGKTMTEQVAQSREEPSPYVPCVIGLNYRERQRLYDRIDLRVHKMLELGMEQEIRNVYEKNSNGTLMQAIGIKEFVPYFRGECSLEAAVQTIQINSRHYAKRQLTWFRRDERVHWLYRDDPACERDLLGEASKIIDDFLLKYNEG